MNVNEDAGGSVHSSAGSRSLDLPMVRSRKDDDAIGSVGAAHI